MWLLFQSKGGYSNSTTKIGTSYGRFPFYSYFSPYSRRHKLFTFRPFQKLWSVYICAIQGVSSSNDDLKILNNTIICRTIQHTRINMSRLKITGRLHYWWNYFTHVDLLKCYRYDFYSKSSNITVSIDLLEMGLYGEKQIHDEIFIKD